MTRRSLLAAAIAVVAGAVAAISYAGFNASLPLLIAAIAAAAAAIIEFRVAPGGFLLGFGAALVSLGAVSKGSCATAGEGMTMCNGEADRLLMLGMVTALVGAALISLPLLFRIR